jgi:hypothetical protein
MEIMVTFLYSGRLDIASNLQEIIQQIFSDVFRIDTDLQMPDLNSPRKEVSPQNLDVAAPDHGFPVNYTHPDYNHDLQGAVGNEASALTDLSDPDDSAAVLGNQKSQFSMMIAMEQSN